MHERMGERHESLIYLNKDGYNKRAVSLSLGREHNDIIHIKYKEIVFSAESLEGATKKSWEARWRTSGTGRSCSTLDPCGSPVSYLIQDDSWRKIVPNGIALQIVEALFRCALDSVLDNVLARDKLNRKHGG